jgi:tetratricopeptide (TPR) repeat protein
MAKVFLRVYNREIESMIEGGQLDEAVAHCQYILKTFPMDVDTYRLLGKAFLEARRYADAADIFQRVLMAVPDDFVSHVGMSIIRDDENKMDDSIWHMERAFEVQPSNSAIQGELRRLYGRRDGVEPTKIRLSRDALANMYSQGELFNQAIAEIRSVLAEDTNRPDLQVMLARAYYRSGQKVEAAEMAAALLKKYPYCMDALRVLVDVLPGTARAENTQVYRQRLHNLDPYSSFTVNSAFASDQVVDSAVNLDRLEYKSGPATVSSQPDWASSLGIKLDDEKPADTPPAWMQAAEPPEQLPASTSEPAGPLVAPATPAEVESVPEWMRSAGWQESNTTEKVDSANSGESLPDEPIAKADIPDWVKSMAPTDATEAVTPEPDEPAESLSVGEDGIPDWLKPTGSLDVAGKSQLEAQKPPESQPVGGADVPDWLKMASTDPGDELHVDTPSQPVEPQQAPVESQAASVDEAPDWLQSMASTEAIPQAPEGTPEQQVETQPVNVESRPQTADDIPDWLKSMGPAESVDEVHVETPVQSVEPQQAPIEPAIANADDVPDWLKSTTPVESIDEAHVETPLQPVEPQQAPIEPAIANADDVPDWLKSLAPTEAVGEPLAEAKETVEPQPEPAEFQPASADGVIDWLKPLDSSEASDESQAGDLQQPVEPQAVGVDATPDWLKPLTPAEASGDVHVETTEPPVEPQPEIADSIPSILPAENAGAPGDISEPMPVEPSFLESEAGSIPAETGPAKAESFPDWLTGIGARADAAALTARAMEQPIANQSVSEIPVPPQPAAQVPDKSQTPSTSTSGETFRPTGEVKPLNIGDDAFGWLESLAAKQGAKPEELLTNPNERSGEMPDWLRQPGEKAVDATESVPQESVPAIPGTLPLEPLSVGDSIPASKPAHTIDEDMNVKNEKPAAEPSAETVAQPADQTVNGEDDTMAWLEQMAANQGTKLEEPTAGSRADSGITPDWIQKMQEDQPAGPATEETIPATPEPAPAEEDVTITSWLSKMDVDDAIEKISGGVQAEAAPAEPAGELPDWLKDLEKPAAPVEVPKADTDLPGWLQSHIRAKANETNPPTPIVDSTPEPELPAWVDENVSVTGQAAPTMPEEWLPAETKADDISNALPPAEVSPIAEITPEIDSSLPPVSASVSTIEVVPGMETLPVAETIPPAESTPIPGPAPVHTPTLKQTGMLSHIPVQDKDAELLSSAQNVLDQNSLDEAMKKYSKLIKKGRLLDEVIHDLREAIYRYPVDVIVWQTMGDAYMRANRLQDALDSYTKAEELLR